ncbi:MAG: hypothetical protein HoeaKO_18080 [Hoeflea alexandrii]
MTLGGGLRADAIFLPEGTTEKIGSELQTDDLLTPIGHHLGQFDHAGNDVGVALCLQAFANQFGFGLDRAPARMLAELEKLLAGQGSADTAVTAFTSLAQQWRV